MPFYSRGMVQQMKKEEKAEKARIEEEKRKAEEEAAKAAEEKRKHEEAEAASRAAKEAEEKALKKTEQRRTALRHFLTIYNKADTKPIEISDEETFKMRFGLVIDRRECTSTYHSMIYPVRADKPEIAGNRQKPVETGIEKMVVRVTLLDRCSADYRRHILKDSLRTIKFFGSNLDPATSPTSTSAAPLRHSSLVRVWDVFICNNKIYIFMEELPQCTLASLIKQKKKPIDDGKNNPLTNATIHQFGRQVGEALSFLHDSAFAHLNVRSDNFVVVGWTNDLQQKAQIKMVGLSQLYIYWDPDQEQVIRHKPIKGRNYFDHLPSEVFKVNSDFDPLPVDVFGLGVLMYQMMVGDKPFSKQHPFKGGEDMQKAWVDHCRDYKNQMIVILPSCLALMQQILGVSKPEDRPSLDKILQHEYFSQSCPGVPNLIEEKGVSNKESVGAAAAVIPNSPVPFPEDPAKNVSPIDATDNGAVE